MTEREEPRPDPSDGLLAMPVGEWAREKHALLKLYIEISRAVRRKFIGQGKAGATFIDLYSGSGRAYIKGTDTFIDGSPLVGWHASVACKVPFTGVHINDVDGRLLDAAYSRLQKLGAPVSKYGGEANLVAARLADELDPYGLHFALLDPFDLVLPVEVIRCLSQLKRIDLLIHVSAMDLQRNWGKIYTAKALAARRVRSRVARVGRPVSTRRFGEAVVHQFLGRVAQANGIRRRCALRVDHRLEETAALLACIGCEA